MYVHACNALLLSHDAALVDIVCPCAWIDDLLVEACDTAVPSFPNLLAKLPIFYGVANMIDSERIWLSLLEDENQYTGDNEL